jgi:hypothetical protein
VLDILGEVAYREEDRRLWESSLRIEGRNPHEIYMQARERVETELAGDEPNVGIDDLPEETQRWLRA